MAQRYRKHTAGLAAGQSDRDLDPHAGIGRPADDIQDLIADVDL